jgi:hypothetical protein
VLERVDLHSRRLIDDIVAPVAKPPYKWAQMKNRVPSIAAGLAVGTLTGAIMMAVACGGGSQAGPSSNDSGSPDALSIDSAGPDGGGDASSGDASSGDANPGDANPGDATGDSPNSLVPPAYLKQPAISSFVYTANFGSPYDSILAAPMQSVQSAIAPGFTTGPVVSQVHSSYGMQELSSTADLYDALNISASLDVVSGAFSGSAKATFAQSRKVDTSKVVIFADSTAVGLATQIVNPQLAASAANLSPADFYSLYGDRYAAQVITGIELFGTIEVDTTSEEDKQSVETSLNLMYGASMISGTFTSTIDNTLKGKTVHVYAQAIGLPTPAFNDDPAAFLTAVSNFASNYAVDGGANTSAQALELVYSSYYGIPGYPGVPAGTDVKVQQHAQAASDYLLYDSLVQFDFAAYFADPNYATVPFLTGMKAYRDGLGTYLTAANTNSQSLPTLPTPAAAGKLETYTTTATTYAPNGASSSPQYVLHTLDNGFVPKRLSDYEIPFRYTKGSNTLNGATFSPVASVQSSGSTTAAHPLVYHLYPVDKTVYPQPQNRVLSYQWDTGTYQLPGVFSGGQPSQSLIVAALTGSGFTIYDSGSGKQPYQFVVVNKATGFLLTDNSGANSFTTVTSSNPANIDPSGTSPTQIWGFDLSCSPGDTMPWASPAQVLLRSQASTNIIDFQSGSNSPGTKLETYTFTCNDEQKFQLVAEDGGGTWAIWGSGNYNALYVQAQGKAAGSSVVGDPLTPSDNQLWVIIPIQNLDTP